MALKIRRGTDAQRLLIIPQEGEIIYTTDTKELYAGDGVTVGGNLITGSVANSPAALTRDLDLDSYDIIGAGDINITGTVTADFNGNLVGDVVGNVVGDVVGSVFADDSTPMLDAINRRLTSDIIDLRTGTLTQTNDRAILNFVNSTNNNISTSPDFLGTIYFQRDDVNGLETPSFIIGGNTGVYIANNITGTIIEDNYTSITANGLGVGTYFPSAKLDVKGNAIITGGLTADLIGSVFADNSTLLVDAVNGVIPGYISIAELQTALQDGIGDFAAFKSYILGLS